MSLRSHHPALRHLRDERGFTLIELLVSMLIALAVVPMAAFRVAPIHDRRRLAHHRARTRGPRRGARRWRRSCCELHSACVAPNVNPGPAGEHPHRSIKFSQRKPEDEPAFRVDGQAARNRLQRPPAKAAPHRKDLAERRPETEWRNYHLPKTASKPQSELLTGVRQTKPNKKTPIFQYYRYYRRRRHRAKRRQTPTANRWIPKR